MAVAEHRRRFDEEYKKSVVDDLVRTQEKLGGGSPFAIVAKRYDVHEQLLRNWNKQYGDGRVKPTQGNQHLAAPDAPDARRERERARKRAYRERAEDERAHRKFDETFKRAVVAEFLDTAASSQGSAVTPVARKHRISTTMLREWIRRYAADAPAAVARTRAFPDNLDEIIAARQPPPEPPQPPVPSPEGRDVAVITGGRQPPPGGKLEFVRVEAHHYDDIVAHIQNLEQQLREVTDRLRLHEAEKHVLKQALNIVNDARVTG